MLDASGFRRSKVFAGNVRAAHAGRHARGARGATRRPRGHGPRRRHRLQWLRPTATWVSRERHRQFDAAAAVSLRTQSNQTVHLRLDRPRRGPPVLLLRTGRLVVSPSLRGGPDPAPRRAGAAPAHKRLNQVWQRIGRLKTKHSRVASHYPRADGPARRRSPSWTRRPRDGSMVTHPGVYCLRSSETESPAHLHDPHRRGVPLAQVCRPIYHHKPRRADGHLFITVIAYQLVQVIRTRLRAHGNAASWTTLRRILDGQQRVTATFRRPDGHTLHVRTATQAEPGQRATTRSASTPTPGASARPSSDRRFGARL